MAKGYGLHEGPSPFDGQPIVSIATLHSSNRKTGGLVQLDDLCAALRSGQLARAALDVLPVEPPGLELEALLETPNLLISPHMGWSSRQARSRLVQTLAGHLKAYVSAEARHSQRRMNNP